MQASEFATIDLEAIERDARRLRAESMRAAVKTMVSWMKSLAHQGHAAKHRAA